MSVFRLVEGIISIGRPTQPVGNAYYDGMFNPTVNQLFDFGAVRKDVHIECDQEITVRFNSTSAPAITIVAGVWDFTDENANKAYITFGSVTNMSLYANG